MADKLGQSQIIPYILEINKTPNINLSVVSFEKNKKKIELSNILSSHNIKWYPLKFTNNNLFFFKLIDFIKILIFPIFLNFFKKFEIIHCRGQLSSMPGYLLKKYFSKKFIFDCRGLWADERVDNRSWDQSKLFYKVIYNFFKKFEVKLFLSCDHCITLTDKLKKLLISKYQISPDKINVIPCVADYDRFQIESPYKIKNIKKNLKIPKSDFIVGYFGSISNIYNPEKMIDFYLYLKKFKKNPILIFFSDNFEYLMKIKKIKYLINSNQILFISPSNEDIPLCYNLCDLTLCFVINSYARLASFPTKIAETLACGTPVIANKFVGDLNTILPKIHINSLVNVNNKADLIFYANKVKRLTYYQKKQIRLKSNFYLNLIKAEKHYKIIYKKLI